MISFDDRTYERRLFVLIRLNRRIKNLIRLQTFVLKGSDCKLFNNNFMPLGKCINYRCADKKDYSPYTRGRVWTIDAIYDLTTGLHIDIIWLPRVHLSIVL